MTAASIILLSPADNVVVANGRLEAGAELPGGFVAAQAVESGHKVAIRPIAAGTSVVKYAQAIGRATRDIAPGEHVHSHNLAFETGRLPVVPPSTPLAATEVARIDDAALFRDAPARASFAVAELLIGGQVVHRTIVERAPPGEMAYPAPGLRAAWKGDSVTLSATGLARAVMLDFGTVAAQPSDNGFDLLPGESVTVTIASEASRAALARALTLRSLAR